MKRICIVRHSYYPADVRVRKEALALADKGHQVDVICLKNKNEKRRETHKKVNIFRLPIMRQRRSILRYFFEYLSFFFLASIRLCLLFLRNKYDYVQVNTLPDFLVFVTLIPKIFGAKVILDLHEPSPELYGTIFGTDRKFLIGIVKFFEQISIRYSDHAITVSQQMKDNYIQRGSSPSKISVILNVPNLEFNPDLFKEHERINEDKKSLSLVCHGTVIKRYGQDVAIKAISRLKKEIPFIQLNILGVGEYLGELKKIVSRLELNDFVHFHGFLPFLDMIQIIANTDIGIVPVEKNPYSDLVHTNKMFEFIAMRKPVIISRTKAVEDFFGSDDTCLMYFESGNEGELAKCIKELYKNPKKRIEMVENAYAKFESVRWEILKEDYCNLFLG